MEIKLDNSRILRGVFELKNYKQGDEFLVMVQGGRPAIAYSCGVGDIICNCSGIDGNVVTCQFPMKDLLPGLLKSIIYINGELSEKAVVEIPNEDGIQEPIYLV